MRNLKKRPAVVNRVAVKRIGKVQATRRQECKLTVLFTKRHGVKEVLSSRMLLAPERVDALEVMIATLGEVEERGIDKRFTLLVASTLKACKDVATQLNREHHLHGWVAGGCGGAAPNGASRASSKCFAARHTASVLCIGSGIMWGPQKRATPPSRAA